MDKSSSVDHDGTGLQEEKQYDSTVLAGTTHRNETPTISAHCKECIEHYHLLCDELEECSVEQAANVGFNKILALNTMEDARSRFKAWAMNIAALQKPSMRSSLDFRLSEATEIRRMILSILADLKESLGKSSKIISGEAPNERWKLGAVSDSEEEMMVGESDDDIVETCDLEQLFEAIQASNVSLMKLSMIIRNSPARDDYLKAASRYSSYPADWDIKHVQEKHGKAKGSRDWLIERLGKAITRRRQYLMYRREHHDKLSRDYDVVSQDKDEERTNALTKATTFVENKIRGGRDGSDVAGSFGSQTSYEPTVIGEQAQLTIKLTVPPLPKITAEGVPFQLGEVFTCPYCWTPQTVKNKLAWKKHVFHDLKPYVCTFKSCSLRMFRSRNEWFAHELQNHRREWRCYLCSELYNSESSLSSHLLSKHASVAVGAQLQALILKGEEPIDRVSISACMLCDEWEANLTNPTQDARRAFLNQGQSVKPYGTVSQFRRHLGRHMEQLALFALPMNESDQDQDEHSDANQSDDTPDLAQVQNWRQGSVESSASESDKASANEDLTHEELTPVYKPQVIPNLPERPQVDSLDVKSKSANSDQTQKFEKSSDDDTGDQQRSDYPQLDFSARPESTLDYKHQSTTEENYEVEQASVKSGACEIEKEHEAEFGRVREEPFIQGSVNEKEAEDEKKRLKEEADAAIEKYKLEIVEKEAKEQKEKEEREKDYRTRLEEDLQRSGMDERQISIVLKKEVENRKKRIKEEADADIERKRLKEEADAAIEKYKLEIAEKEAKEQKEKEEREKDYRTRLEEDLQRSGMDERQISIVLKKEVENRKKRIKEEADADIERKRLKEEADAAIEKYKLEIAEKEAKEQKEKEEREKEYRIRLEEDLRKSGMDERQISTILKKDKGVDPNRPTYTRMSRRHLSIETLNAYRIDYEFDQDPEYVLIKRWVPEYEQDFLWNHTREIRERRGSEVISSIEVPKKKRERRPSPSPLLTFLAGRKR